MAGSTDDGRSPAASWQTEEDDDEEVEFEPAESGLSETTGDDITEDDDEEDDDEEEEDEDGQGTTIYFDAQDGIFRDEDGDEVDFEVNTESAADESMEESADANTETGASTPTETTAETTQQPRRQGQTIVLSPQEILQLLSHPGVGTETQQQILQLLSHPGIRGILSPQRGGGNAAQSADDDDDDNDDDDDDDDESDVSFLQYGRRRRRPKREFVGDRYPPIPSAEGQKLMANGTFGISDHYHGSACGLPYSNTTLGKRKRFYRRMFEREMGVENRGRQRVLNTLAVQDMIPKSKADLVINMSDRCYSGQFSDDGSFFFACGQDYTVRMYDTSNPYDWKYYKKAHFYGAQWTITDATLSPDNKYLAYSSIRPQICLTGTDRNDESDPTMLDISDMGTSGRGAGGRTVWGHWGIWSIRFSGDGREIVAGTNDASVYVYDLESRRSILRIPGHRDDVNAVCYGDKLSPHILYSGSDDTTLKVWDRRSLASMRPAGMFLGHTEGLTYIDSKGDGRYVISNAKDQTCKLWDLRKMISVDVADKINPQNYTTNFDYRYPPYDTALHEPHPHDCSLVTFRGHRVLQTLIRCHFSPEHSTGGRYVYSGSYDGKVYVWNLDGTPASEPINVLEATKHPRSTTSESKTIVRDCSWHPSAPVIAATSWNAWEHGRGTCSVHSWTDGVNDDEVGNGRDDVSGDDYRMFSESNSLGSRPMGARVTAELNHSDRFYRTSTRTSAGTRSRPGARLAAFWNDGDDDDDDDDDYEDV